jgi:hypothetical protein
VTGPAVTRQVDVTVAKPKAKPKPAVKKPAAKKKSKTRK